MKVEIAKDERVEDLECHGLKIIQNKNYYTLDLYIHGNNYWL